MENLAFSLFSLSLFGKDFFFNLAKAMNNTCIVIQNMEPGASSPYDTYWKIHASPVGCLVDTKNFGIRWLF